MRDTVLITGASSGIGAEMAREVAGLQFDLVLVARREDRLLELKKELETRYAVRATVICADLSLPRAAEILHREIKGRNLSVSMLINNAGTGQYGEFLQLSLESQMSMMTLNCNALMELTYVFAADFKAKGKGRIMNLASLLSFFPFPYFSVYAATKAFVLSFSEAIRSELRSSGITVTALCPGPVDSSFTTPEMATTNAYQKLSLMDPKQVAKKGIKAMLEGKGTVILGLQNKILANTPRISPRALSVQINKFMGSPAIPLPKG